MKSMMKCFYKGAFGVLLIALLVSCNTNKVEKIISEMTLEEKIDFIGGYNSFNIRGYEHLGIPEIRMADGPVGVRNFGKSIAYPAGINLAASWDKTMAYNIGKAIGSDARSVNCHMMLGPGMNIYRMPLCGRNFEYLGEDPYLAGTLAAEYIKGLQGEGVIACAKHYVANNQEFNRHHVSSNMDERTLHEIYLPAFKKSVQDGKVASVMTSYNLINDIHASQHDYLIKDVLKGKWGFDGFAVSDWVSTYDGVACAKGGLDLEMPSGKMMNRETLMPVIESGELSVEVIDDKIRRILNTYERFGFFETPDISKDYVYDEKFSRDIAIDAARGGMVLLKNERDILPLKKDELKTVAVIGPNGHPAITGGGGSSKVDPKYPLSLFEAIKKVSGENNNVVYERGMYAGTPFPEEIFENFDFYVYENGEKKKGVNAEFFNNKELEGETIYTSFYEDLRLVDSDLWKPEQVPEYDFSVRFNCFFSPKESAMYSIAGKGDDGYRIKLDGKEKLDMWRDQGPTPAKFEVFLNAGQEYKIELEYYQSGGGAYIELGAAKAKEDEIKPEEYYANAIKAAKKADLVIMSVGFNPDEEAEGFDRTFEMPYKQGALINDVAKVNDNIIVVLNSGGNVEMESWINNVDALLMAWYPGQEGNLAAAEILYGITNPSGKLPASFAYKLEDNPCYNSYFDDDDDLKVTYSEGIFIGYRYWDQTNAKPRFPFGYGLSYTTFEYSGLTCDKAEYASGEKVKVTCTVKNTGDLDGAEVVQLYVSDKECTLKRPIKELKDFTKVQLTKGEEKTVEFELNKDAFAFYNSENHDWEVEPGEFVIMVGASSDDIRETAVVKIN